MTDDKHPMRTEFTIPHDYGCPVCGHTFHPALTYDMTNRAFIQAPCPECGAMLNILRSDWVTYSITENEETTDD